MLARNLPLNHLLQKSIFFIKYLVTYADKQLSGKLCKTGIFVSVHKDFFAKVTRLTEDEFGFEQMKVPNMLEKMVYTSSEVTRHLNISLRQLYYWELKGIVKPECITMGSREFKRYSQSDVEILKKIKQYLEQGYTLNGAVQRAYHNN